MPRGYCMQRAIREIQEKKLRVINKGPSPVSCIIWASGHSWLVGYSEENSSLCFSPWHLLLARCMSGWSSWLQGPCLYKILLHKQNKNKGDKIPFQNQKYTRTAVSGQSWLHPQTGAATQQFPEPSQIQQSGWDSLGLPLRTEPHSRNSWAKGKSRVTSLWAAGLLYGDLLCPLVTTKHKTGNFAPTILVNKNQVLLHLLAGRQAVGLFWLWPEKIPLPRQPGHHSVWEASSRKQGKEMLF